MNFSAAEPQYLCHPLISDYTSAHLSLVHTLVGSIPGRLVVTERPDPMLSAPKGRPSAAEDSDNLSHSLSYGKLQDVLADYSGAIERIQEWLRKKRPHVGLENYMHTDKHFHERLKCSTNKMTK